MTPAVVGNGIGHSSTTTGKTTELTKSIANSPAEIGARVSTAKPPSAMVPAPAAIASKTTFSYDCNKPTSAASLGRRYTDAEKAFMQKCMAQFQADAAAAESKEKWLGRAETAAKVGQVAGEVASTALIFVPGGGVVGAAEKGAAAAVKGGLTIATEKKVGQVALPKIVEKAEQGILTAEKREVGSALSGKVSEPKVTSASPKPDEGCIYCVKGDKTQTGKDYVGSSNDLAKRGSADNRDRTGAKILDTYPKSDRLQRFSKEQEAINSKGGISKLDNKINAVAPKKWDEYGVSPPAN